MAVKPDAKPSGVYGLPPAELAPVPAGAVQFSPLIPGSATLEVFAASKLAAMTMLAPPGTLERRYAIALSLRAVASGGTLTVLALKDKGGARLDKELAAFGCVVAATGKRHYRICEVRRPKAPVRIDAMLAEGAPRRIDAIEMWSQPGIFSWDRIDPGSALLVEHLPALAGRGSDFGCGIGFLARAVLKSSAVKHLTLIDIDRRAIDAARRNIEDPRAHLLWADIESAEAKQTGLDFVVMNPPFHDGGAEDKALGQSFIRHAAASLRPGGTAWLTANRDLPYEAVMKKEFKRVTLKAETGRYKIYEAGKMSKLPTTLRLDRLLSNMGYGARREMQAMIEDGLVTLDGAVIEAADQRIAIAADLSSRMTVDGVPLDPPPGMTLMLHKPLGVTCSRKEPGPLVYSLFPPRFLARDPALSTIGRLDKETSGMLLLTDDGMLLHRIISPKSKVPKRYRVTLKWPMQGSETDAFASGMLMMDGDDTPLLPATLEVLSDTSAYVTITEGRYHQVRRMFASVRNKVVTLHRDRIGNLALPDDLEPGQYRMLTDADLAAVLPAA